MLLADQLVQAFDRRETLLQQLHAEQTDCYRLFHGTVEGTPGLTIDRYGRQLLVQTFHQSLAADQLEAIETCYRDQLPADGYIVYNDRSDPNSRRRNLLSEALEAKARQDEQCSELGVNYRVRGRHRGQDPLLFLDLRVVRRHVLAHSHNKSVLNLFAYTCGVGTCAGAGGASEAVNVDFATSSLDVGRENAALNALQDPKVRFIQGDFFTTVRQFADLPVKARGNPNRRQGRAARQQPKLPTYERFEPHQFDLVVMDPPRFAKSPFGVVDLVRDYPSLLKPALLATREGGELICTNNVAQVELESWLETLRRCAAKCGRPIRELNLLTPESDFPSFDGCPPLKIAHIQL